jgi:subtilisin
MAEEEVEEFVILPTRGINAAAATSSPAQRRFFTGIDRARTTAGARRFVKDAAISTRPDFRVLDSIAEDGAKLVQMTPSSAKHMLAAEPGMRVVPVVLFQPAVYRREVTTTRTARAGAGAAARAGAAVKTTFVITSKADGSAIRKADVVAFTDYAAEVGDQGKTNNQGMVQLRLRGARVIERVFVYPDVGFWGAMTKNIEVHGNVAVALTPVDLGFQDVLRYFYGNAPLDAGRGVTVAVVDTGVDPHPDLVISGGQNTVVGENKDDYGSNGDSHGTHVAGIIAARGTPPRGIRGVAPGVTLRSYRVYAKGKGEAKNYAIVKGIDAAVRDGCDVINLSLAGDPDPATRSAIDDARQRGSLVVAAAGNDGRKPVGYPAADPLCIGVSAVGRKGTFPRGSDPEGDVMAPYGTDAANFIAAFSNIGPQIDVCGPGVGILSTVPGGYVPMSGTSMACPAVAGVAARLLAADNAVRAMARSQQRSDAIAALLLQAARTLGFPAKLQGQGLPMP